MEGHVWVDGSHVCTDGSISGLQLLRQLLVSSRRCRQGCRASSIVGIQTGNLLSDASRWLIGREDFVEIRNFIIKIKVYHENKKKI
jgi:hypothetical protein